MENASKAIIIAGGMLIAMVLISLLIVAFNQISSYMQARTDSESIEEISEFNEKFEAYNSKTLRGYQMISLANLTTDINSRYTEEEGYKEVTIYANFSEASNLSIIRGTLSNSQITKVDIVNYVNNIYPKLSQSTYKTAFKELYFECTDIEYDSNGRVLTMYFKIVNVVT